MTVPSSGEDWDPDEDPARVRRLLLGSPTEHARDLAESLGRAVVEIDRLRARAEARRRPSPQMNPGERSAWRLLLDLGARFTEIGGKATLDLRPIRATSEKKLRLLLQAHLDVAGRSGCNRRHVDRAGIPVYVVTDDPDPPRPPGFCVKCGVDVRARTDGACPRCGFHTVEDTQTTRPRRRA